MKMFFLILFECLMRPFLINVFKNIYIVLGYTNEINFLI